MKFEELLRIVENEPVFETSFLLAGDVNPEVLQVQLPQWVRRGKLIRLRRGLYALAPPYQRVQPHPFVVANRMVKPSYVSLQSALAYYGLIPETVFAVTSVTTAKPGRFHTPLGTYLYRRLTTKRFFGYTRHEVAPGQFAWIATPEKALLDLLYLTPGSDVVGYLQELRLDWRALDFSRLESLAQRMQSPKLQRAVRRAKRFWERAR